MTANSTAPDTGRRLRAMEDALYNLQRERTPPLSTLDNCPAGMVAGFLSSHPPQGWMLLDGSTVTQAGQPRLYAYLVANGFSTTLPDYRDRVAIGAGNLYSSTSTGGSADGHYHGLGTAAVASKYTTSGAHTHEAQQGFVAEGPSPSSGDSIPANVLTGNVGNTSGVSGDAVGANLPPYRGLYWMIRT